MVTERCARSVPTLTPPRGSHARVRLPLFQTARHTVKIMILSDSKSPMPQQVVLGHSSGTPVCNHLSPKMNLAAGGCTIPRSIGTFAFARGGQGIGSDTSHMICSTPKGAGEVGQWGLVTPLAWFFGLTLCAGYTNQRLIYPMRLDG
jgi:hypothetical protein